MRLPPAGVWAIAALALLAFAWTASVTLYVAFHDDLMGAILAHEAQMRAAYEDRLTQARAQLDTAASQQMLERNSFKREVSEVTSRQARLEQRGAIVAALAAETEARNPSLAARRQRASPSDALSAIQALGPPTAAPGPSADGEARAYAPLPDSAPSPRAVKPHPIDESGDALSALPSEAPFTTASATGAAGNPDTSARLSLIDRSLDGVEKAQARALDAIDQAAERSASRAAAIVAETGLDAAKLSLPRAQGGVGGPFIPAEIDPKALARDPALTRVARDVATAERLKALLSFVPLRMPLAGDPSVTSPFGYRADPFLGRLALHPGVDLAEAYGSEIHAAAAGRVVHAGPAGRLRNHGRDRSRQRPRHPLRPHVGSFGRGGPGGRQGRPRRPARLDRPLDRPASALRSARRRRAGRSQRYLRAGADLAAAQ